MAADVYAVGEVLLDMQQAWSGDAGFEVVWDNIVDQCKSPDPEQRPTCEELVWRFDRLAEIL